PEIAPPDFAPLLDEDDRDRLHRALVALYGLRGLARHLGLQALAYRVLMDSGVLDRLLALDAGPARDRALGDLRTALDAFGELEDVWSALHGAGPRLEEVAGQLPAWIASAAQAAEGSQPDGDPGAAVQIMTAHQAKGLEFDVVFLSGLARGQFPLAARPHPILTPEDQTWLEALQGFHPSWPRDADAHLAEEARLAYVAVTRARRRLYVTCAAEYEAPAGPSPFVEHLGTPPPSPAMATTAATGVESVLTGGEAELLLFGRELEPPVAARFGALGLDVRWLQEPDAGSPFLPYLTRPTGVDIGHFSPTSLNDYLLCPRLYYYNHHPGLSSPARGVQLERGTFMHKVLEEFHNREDEWWGRAPATQREWLERTLEPRLGRYLEHIDAILERGREEREVRRILENYIAFITDRQEVRRLRTLVTEKRFLLDLDGAQVRGKIDRIVDSGDGSVEVIDYKTGHGKGIGRTYERYFGEHLHDVQLLMYEIACREGADETGAPLGLRPGLLSVWFPKDWVYGAVRQSLFPLGHEALGVKKAVQHPITEDDIARGRSIAAAAIRHIKDGDFEPRPRPDLPGSCLSYFGCPHQAICPFGGSAPE
ncbi:MAG: PD-(D/E)XK nuclease family protein, partial [Candidatus Dormibacteraceae bacterium]